MRIFGSLLFLAIGCGSLLAACSSTTSNAGAGGCGSNPFACPAGQTCSVKDAAGTFACLPSGSGKSGDACLNTAGVATCGDTLVCLQVVQSGGNCTHYCEAGSSAHGCNPGEQCRAAEIQGTSTVFYVCVGSTPPAADAGAGDAAEADSSSAKDAASQSDAAAD
jgi:hypothetical protein